MKRFEKVYGQGTIDVTEIWVDTETGVNYSQMRKFGRFHAAS